MAVVAIPAVVVIVMAAAEVVAEVEEMEVFEARVSSMIVIIFFSKLLNTTFVLPINSDSFFETV